MTQPLPKIAPPSSVHLADPEHFVLDNGIEVFGYNGAANAIVKLELIFNAGRWAETEPLTAGACASLLKSGTATHSAYVLEEEIDFLGATIKASAGYNSFTVSLYCMTRHLGPCLEILVRLLQETNFPQDELALYKTNRLSRLKVNKLKNDYTGDILFKEAMFGTRHPYGYATTEEAIEALSTESIRQYYTSWLRPSNCTIGISGNYAPSVLDLLNKYLGQKELWQHAGEIPEMKPWDIEASETRRIEHQLPKSVQASIYIGKQTIGRHHEDHHVLSFLNLIYGGYFGSRLMKNIREEKGLTYGIYSYLQHFRHASAFIVNTDTGVANVDTCLREIYLEMDRLKEEAVDRNELLKARNYLLGRLLEQVDGPFRSASTFLNLRSHGLQASFINDIEIAIRNIEPTDLMRAADKYFGKEGMYEVVVK